MPSCFAIYSVHCAQKPGKTNERKGAVGIHSVYQKEPNRNDCYPRIPCWEEWNKYFMDNLNFGWYNAYVPGMYQKRLKLIKPNFRLHHQTPRGGEK